MKWIIAIASAGIAAAVWAMPAAAQSGSDTCSDILRNGTLQTTQIQDNRYFQQIRASREQRTRRRTEDVETSADVGIPIEGVPFNASGTGNYRTTNASTSDTSRFDWISEDREFSALLSSGDPTIVSAWSRCMDNGPGGLTARFVVHSAKEALLLISWRPGRVGNPTTGFPDAHLRDNIVLPAGVTVMSGQHCLLASNRITEGTCEVNLQLDSATRTLAVSLNTDRGVGAHAYLPQRLRHAVSSRPHIFSASDNAYRSLFREQHTVTVTHTAQLSEALTNEGWRFDPESIGFDVRKTSGGPHHRCHSPLVTDKQAYQITYQYRARTSFEDRDDRNTRLKCLGTPTARLVRDRWIAMD
ncbi:hypothetical protein [Sphingomonas sp. LM7]|uniref:hypothetical protein n=1 Tax=Sphingomonas sp. LM7 TaxID=1938607 RepID=UPI000983DD32|nr:hypothetical protein [Sphingomonas sp. LM7]AQR73534.1 hypothetical protein BXU08_07675 [Sphingomonas sp. LM7]